MLATVPSATLLGVDGHPVSVEVHTGTGLPGFTVVGQPDAACREARDRVRSALENSGIPWPARRITVNLAPTDVRKAGAGLDLAIAVGILTAEGLLESAQVGDRAFVGELGLDGSLRPPPGILALAACLRGRPVVPESSLSEAQLSRPDALGAPDLAAVVAALRGAGGWSASPRTPAPPRGSPGEGRPPGDLSEVRGQPLARVALEVAAAGSHHLLMNGPPGSGKTMLAERLAGLLPDLDDEEALEVTRVHSAAGCLPGEAVLVRRPPWRAPHHTASMTALVGGGSTQLRPGEVSLASGGVLFLDELGEFPASHLDALRQPLESGAIQVSRASVSARLPARVLLVAATNPCPCGVRGYGDCSCSDAQLARYRRRLSGPLLDRFDLRIGVGPPDPAVVLEPIGGEDSATVRRRVEEARGRARRRGVTANRMLQGRALRAAAPLDSGGERMLRDGLERGLITMRGAERVRAVALTLADLRGHEVPLGASLLSQALVLRCGDGAAVT